jgi:hypothetical protein
MRSFGETFNTCSEITFPWTIQLLNSIRSALIPTQPLRLLVIRLIQIKATEP